MKAWIFGVLLLGMLFPWNKGVFAQDLSADEIITRMMEKNAQRQEMLQGYTSERTYHLEYNGTAGEHHAEMDVHVVYTSPGKKRLTVVSESGSKVLCAEVLRKLVDGEQETADKENWQREMFSPETYNFQLLGRENLEGVSTWALAVEPKAVTKVGYKGRLWVSTDDYAMVRLQAAPAKNPSWLLSHAMFDAWYARHGAIWLPQKNLSTSHLRFGGDAKVMIDYGQYSLLATVPVRAPEFKVAAPRQFAPKKQLLGEAFR